MIIGLQFDAANDG